MPTTDAQDLQDTFLSAIRKGQDITLQATKVWVDTADYFLPKVSFAHLPFVRLLPKPHDIVGSSFDLAERMLASQRSFTDDILKVTSQLLPDEARALPPETRGRRPGVVTDARGGPATS